MIFMLKAGMISVPLLYFTLIIKSQLTPCHSFLFALLCTISCKHNLEIKNRKKGGDGGGENMTIRTLVYPVT